MKRALVIFTKIPIEGISKTRLYRDLTACQSVKLSKCMILDLIERFKGACDMDVFISYMPRDRFYEISEYCENLLSFPQVEGNLNDKMYHSMREVFNKGYHKVVLIGSDIPEITNEVVEDAFLNLGSSNVVFGPSNDGGYYLIGVDFKSFKRDIFEIPKIWGSHGFIEEFSSLRISYIRELVDIDYVEDIKKIKNSPFIGRRTSKFLEELERELNL